MTVILSTTYDDMYLFYLPLTVWSWNKIGFDCLIAMPFSHNNIANKKLDLIHAVKNIQNLNYQYVRFEAPAHKEATYAQCSRLYGSSYYPNEEILITGDIDMAVFNYMYFSHALDGNIHVFGNDLVPENQYPICYISMMAKTWRQVMHIEPNTPIQYYLDKLLGDIECEHFKGNYWGKDQETIYRQLKAGDWPIISHERAAPGTQFATCRADRDGWPEQLPAGIIDAHLPRPGYTDANFVKILKLFEEVYPKEDFSWMTEYRDNYLKLL